MNPTSQHWKEARRLQAWRLKQQDWSQRQMAEALGVSEAAVSQWMQRVRAGGPEALRHRPLPGAARRLATKQLTHLPDLLRRGPEAYGFRGQVWTRKRVAEVMRVEWGVMHHPTHVGRLLKAIRWSSQKPRRRAQQRDEAAIAQWRDDTWPAIKKGAEAQRQTILFIDESGFYPLPSVVRTYAPTGRTPVLKEWCTRDHLSAISAISPEGQLNFHSQDAAINADDVVAFLEHPLREVPGRMRRIWDGAPIHRSHTIREFLAHGAAQRLHLERLPAYALELHPDEGLWQPLKGVERRHVGCCTIPHLRRERRDAVKRGRRKPRLIHRFFRGAKL